MSSVHTIDGVRYRIRRDGSVTAPPDLQSATPNERQWWWADHPFARQIRKRVKALKTGVKLGTHCGICHKLLNDPRDPSSHDCGGDCWACVGEAEGHVINTHPIIKRGGIFSKARMCFWCRGDMRKQRRWTGWWARPKGWKHFRPCCSHHAGCHQAEGATVELRTT